MLFPVSAAFWSGAMCHAIAGAAVLVAAAGASAQIAETEPNNNKPQANMVVMGPGAATSIMGVTTGASTTTPGSASADYFLIRTVPMQRGIYRHELSIASSTPNHTVTIRGLNQVNGVIGTQDVTLQTSSATSEPARIVSWDGFGKQEQVYVRVTGTATTTAPYLLTLTTTQVMPIAAPPILVGPVTFSMVSTVDTDMVIYNSNFDPIGQNDNDVSPVTSSSFALNSSEDVLYVKSGKSKIASSVGAFPSDLNQNGNVTDGQNYAVSSDNPTTGGQFDLQANDGVSGASSCIYTIEPGGTAKTKWVCYAAKATCCAPNSACTLITRTACTAIGGTWNPQRVCAATSCIPAGWGACCEGSICTVRPVTACIGPFRRYVGDGVPCNEPGVNTQPCCKADYNQSGALSVQDVFDFLAGYFQMDPKTNYNGGLLSVQDLFDFLGGYFGGC